MLGVIVIWSVIDQSLIRRLSFKATFRPKIHFHHFKKAGRRSCSSMNVDGAA